MCPAAARRAAAWLLTVAGRHPPQQGFAAAAAPGGGAHGYCVVLLALCDFARLLVGRPAAARRAAARYWTVAEAPVAAGMQLQLRLVVLTGLLTGLFRKVPYLGRCAKPEVVRRPSDGPHDLHQAYDDGWSKRRGARGRCI